MYKLNLRNLNYFRLLTTFVDCSAKSQQIPRHLSSLCFSFHSSRLDQDGEIYKLVCRSDLYWSGMNCGILVCALLLLWNNLHFLQIRTLKP